MFCNAFCIDFLIPLYLSIVVLLFGKLSISEFVIAINAGTQIQRKLEDLTGILSDFLKNGRFAERIRGIDKIQCNIEAAAGGRPVDSMQTLLVNKATFFYPDGTLGLSDSIKELDAQLTREFDENGILFSGGLLQRLALARVFYQDSDIVIMDEPTTAMDVFFERQFYDTVFENLKEKTVIFISNRLSSVTACDKIIFMDHGKILEEGTHEYLMNLQGGYYKLFQAQFE